MSSNPRLPPINNREALRRTVQEFPEQYGGSYIFQLSLAADEAPAWWSPSRDSYLDKFWPTEPYLAGAVYSVASRNAGFRYELTGPERDVWWAQKLLTQADFGQGWQGFIMKLTTDLLVMGNGAFFEVIRPAKAQTKDYLYDAIMIPSPINSTPIWVPFDSRTGKLLDTLVQDEDFKLIDTPYSLPIGLAHLDAAKCVRTGDPMFPVVYTDALGQMHKLSWYQVVTLEEMPSPRQEMHNVQHSAVDRCLRLAQILRDMLIYKHEKISGRFARAVYITNADARQLQDAVNQANTNADDRGLVRYMQPIIFSTVDPSADPKVATIPLATLPDGFSEEDTMRWYVAGVANAFAVDYGFLAPLPGNKLGTSTQAETQERQAKGKSSRLFMQLLTHKFNYSGILPRTVQFQFATSDPWEESEKDRAQARRMRSYQTMIQSGLLPVQIVRQIASDRGDIDPKYLDLMGETDLTPIVTIGSTDVQRVTRHRLPRISPEQLQLFQMPQQQPQRPQFGGGGNGNGDGE